MKRKLLPLALIIPIFLFLIISCLNSNKMRKYYAEKSNYLPASGTVSYIRYSDDGTALYIAFSELDPEFDDTCFKIVGNNLPTVQEKGIDEKIAVGDTVEFISAPRYFGDGYVMPIVGITANGEVLLEFEQGYDNLLLWLDE